MLSGWAGSSSATGEVRKRCTPAEQDLRSQTRCEDGTKVLLAGAGSLSCGSVGRDLDETGDPLQIPCPGMGHRIVLPKAVSEACAERFDGGGQELPLSRRQRPIRSHTRLDAHVHLLRDRVERCQQGGKLVDLSEPQGVECRFPGSAVPVSVKLVGARYSRRL
ncbi:hypothetical protein C1A38_11615 [Verrucosispora sp. ts21]|nr:hypothetical protein C1A38_11615 [Verrucosispora sp. ts21]